MAGALWAFVYLGSWEPAAFGRPLVPAAVHGIIGGLGSICGSFFGAAFIVLMPIALSRLPTLLGLGMVIDDGLLTNLQKILFGSLIVFFLIREPRRPAIAQSSGCDSPPARA